MENVKTKTCPYCGSSLFTVTSKGFDCYSCGVKGDKIDLHALETGCSRTKSEYLLVCGTPDEPDYRRLKEVSALAVAWFQKNLTQTDYFVKRGFSKESIATFGLGYFPKKAAFRKFMKENNITEEEACAAGLINKKDDGTYSQFLYGRVVFPIINSKNWIVGFAGRGITEEDCKYGKYLNSSENMLFHKRDNLYGIHDMPDSETVYVVEGYADCISLHQNGIRNSVACMGTVLTREQLTLLKSKGVKNIVFCLDADEAGQKAMKRSIPAVRQMTFNVSVMQIADGKDPDEFLRNHSASEFVNNPTIPWQLFLLANNTAVEHVINVLY